MSTTFVVAMDGTKLMPTTNDKKVRKFLRSGRAEIFKYRPFTIRLLYETTKDTQPIEVTEDVGYQTMGLSIKSEKHEYVSDEYTLLNDEKKRHDERRKYRRGRRNRRRYRKERFDNRKRNKDWIAPSLKNKADQHVALTEKYAEVCPVTSIVIEAGQFDTQLVKAIEKGDRLPEGKDYQHGGKYGYYSLREAVFTRDGYKCVVCKRSGIPKGNRPGAVLRIHHLGYLSHDRSNRMDNMVTVCSDCHTPANHAEGGKLYGLKPESKPLKGAAFMNTVRWYIYKTLCKRFPGMVSLTYGAATKMSRLEKHIEKSHANDAYCMGEFFPGHRAETHYFRKCRRHNRELSKFHDAVYIDRRDGFGKKGSALSSGRTNRNHKRDTENLHVYRGEKVSKGYTANRTAKPLYRQGDVLIYKGKRYECHGMKSGGNAVLLKRGGKTKSPSVNSVYRVSQTNGWIESLN